MRGGAAVPAGAQGASARAGGATITKGKSGNWSKATAAVGVVAKAAAAAAANRRGKENPSARVKRKTKKGDD